MRLSFLISFFFLFHTNIIEGAALYKALTNPSIAQFEGNNEDDCIKKRKRKFFQKRKSRIARKDWVSDGGFGKLAVGCLVVFVIMLWVQPPGWVFTGLLAGALIFGMIGLVIGGENARFSKGVLGVFAALGVVAGLTLWMISRRDD